MRSGACTVQQALTTEAASVLMHSVSLAKRRGHAQVTPLHVAATLLTSNREETNLFRRACLKSHPLHPNSHPLHCRPLELCFNVALNRLPSIPPPSSGSLLPTHPSLSNALIAALKRAQAHQRRGCMEFQQQQQQQPLLAIQVELEQLIISILDDPSVSRVMREAGFSSTSVKNNLEEDPPSPSVFFDTNREIINQASFWQTHFLKPPAEHNPPLFPSQEEDLRLVLEVLVGKNKRGSSAVMVGDSVSYTEGLLAELMRRVEKGDVPEELRSAQFIKLQLSAVHLKFMCRRDVEMKLSDLRRKVRSLTSERGGVIIYLGDLKWAIEEETRGVEALGIGYRAVDHVIEEVGRLQSEWRSCHGRNFGRRVWIMATASYQTYMRCKMRHPSIQSQWDIQTVSVSSGGLSLRLHVSSGQDSRLTTLSQNPLLVSELKPFNCSFEREASCRVKNTNNGSVSVPFWLQSHKHQDKQEDFHHNNQSLVRPQFIQCRSFADSNSLTQLGNEKGKWKEKAAPDQWLPELNLGFQNQTGDHDVRATLALASNPFSDSATSVDQRGLMTDLRELQMKLKENIPWQSGTAHLIAEALFDRKLGTKGTQLLIQGTDWIAKRRLSRTIAEFFQGRGNSFVTIDAKKPEIIVLVDSLKRSSNCVVLVEDIDYADTNFMGFLSMGFKTGSCSDRNGRTVAIDNAIFVLITKSDDSGESREAVIRIKLQVEYESACSVVSEGRKRKADPGLHSRPKSPRKDTNPLTLDLNISADEDIVEEDDDNVPSDLTQEIGARELHDQQKFGELIDTRFVLDICPELTDRMSEYYRSKISRSFEEVWSGEETDRCLRIDDLVVEELVGASGSFLDCLFDKWLREVFQTCLATFEKGGKLRLSVEDIKGNVPQFGFQGSSLPNRIHVNVTSQSYVN